MATDVPAPPPALAAPPRATRRSRALALPLLALLAPGCETLERMDYLDRFFEPQGYAQQEQEPAPQPVPATAALEPAPAAGWGAQPDRVVAMDPIPDPPAAASARVRDTAPTATAARPAEPAPPPSGTASEERARALVRQHRWLTRFWMELTPEQQERVARRMNRGGVRLAAGRSVDTEAAWDRMGLSDRARLVFGDSPAETPEPVDRRDGAVAARAP